jgi:plasmid stabilization system protein ParE
VSDGPWRLALHPLLLGDVARIGRHVAEASGDPAAGRRRVAEADALLAAIAEGPHLGALLDGALAGYRRRQGGRDGRLTAIYALDEGTRTARVLIMAFGGADWRGRAARRERGGR